jgi:FkbM family methyltransferase
VLICRIFRTVTAAILPLSVCLVACQESREEIAPSSPELPVAERSVYGNRAKFFVQIPPHSRADPDWRAVLDEWISDDEPKWSQGFEELIIRDFFRDRRGGFYLDVGSNYPRWNSTTYYLEDELGWTGIGIDAIPRFAGAWKAYRPNSKFVSYAVTDKDGETATFHIGFKASSLDEESIKAFGGKKGEIKVTTMTLNTILEQNGVEKIDFLSMDIEGAEPAALRGFDIERYRPDLCCVEAVKPDQVMAYFSSHGYELIEKYRKADKINLYFRPKLRN